VGGAALACALGVVLALAPASELRSAVADTLAPVHLELSPRICTLSAKDKQCETRVLADWRAPTPESLCLIVLNHPEIKRCWENYAAGTYSIEMTFSDDLTFQLRDLELQHVLASEVLRIIREAMQYRHKRREPWNVFE